MNDTLKRLSTSMGYRGSNSSMRKLDHYPANDSVTSINEESTSPESQPPVYFESVTSPAQSMSSTFGNRFVVATKEDALSSGFPFDERLYKYGITHDQWHLFTNEIVDAAKITFASDWVAWSTGVTVGTISTAGLLVFGPVAGYYAARPLHRKAVVNNVRKELMHDGQIRTILRRWNEETFHPRGFNAWLELPKLSGEIETTTVEDTSDKKDKKDKKAKKVQKLEARRFRILIIPHDANETSRQLLLEAPKRKPVPVVPLVEASAGRSPVSASSEIKRTEELPSNAPAAKELSTEMVNDAIKASHSMPMELDSTSIEVQR